MLLNMLFYMYEKNTLWIILEISQNLTIGPKYMSWIVALYHSFEAEILNTFSK